MIDIEKIDTAEALHGLKPIWNSLLSKSASNTLGLTWEWMTTWWEVFGEGRQLCVLVVRDGGEVIGIAPLLKRTVQYYGLLSYERLEFLGSGEDEADEICTEYLDFILLAGREEEALSSIFEYLDRKESFDEILLANVVEESVCLPVISNLAAKAGAIV
ncbi:MAG TPA: hypothetical protein VFV34_22650, partial [Blastocatellia bacterium]|nr:hypothetical protein [Blastocatellia bacterium]